MTSVEKSERAVSSGSQLWLGLRSAVAFLTIYPITFKHGEEPATFDSVQFYPLVGLLVGIPIFFAVMLLDPFLDAGSLAILVMMLTAILTRAFHWDALGDVADAWWGGATVERRQEIMSDSSIGAFGVIAIVLVALAGFNVLTLVISQRMYALLIVAPVLARTAPVFGAWLGRAAKTDGLGASVVGKPTLENMLIVGMTVVLVSGLTVFSVGPTGLVGCVFALGLIGAVPHFAARRMGGVTGDVLGVGCLLGELIVFSVLLMF